MKNSKNKTEQQQEKTPSKWGTSFFITINRPTLTALLMDSPLRNSPENIVAHKMSVEIGEKGNLHAHYYIKLARSARLAWYYKHFPGAESLVITPGTESDVIDYVGNISKEVSKGCTVLSEYTTSYGDLTRRQGSRTDVTLTDAVLWDIKASIDAGATTRDLFNAYFPYMIRYGRSLLEYKRIVNPATDRLEHNPV